MAYPSLKARQGAETLIARFAYDPEAGIVFWRDGKRAGREAGAMGARYRQISIGGTTYYSHIVAWVIMTGEFPPITMHIDHRNRDKADNRWSNLRLCTPSENKMNEVERTRSAPVKGARWDSRCAKWNLRMMIRGRLVQIGRYKSLEEARVARVTAEREHYGEFAPVRGIANGVR